MTGGWKRYTVWVTTWVAHQQLQRLTRDARQSTLSPKETIPLLQGKGQEASKCCQPLEEGTLQLGEVLRSDPTGSGRTEERRKDESGGQLSTVHHRTRAGRANTRTEETGDGRSRAGGSERSEEPQRDTREEQVILVLRL